MTSTPINLTMNFDGGCWPNPGGKMTYGWAVWVVSHDSSPFSDDHGAIAGHPPNECTNNTAEFTALLNGIRWLSKLRIPIDTLTIRGDSQLVIKIMNNEWKAKKPHLQRLAADCRTALKTLDVGHIELEWIPREQNSHADALASTR